MYFLTADRHVVRCGSGCPSLGGQAVGVAANVGRGLCANLKID